MIIQSLKAKILIILSLFIISTISVDHKNFRRCDQTGFCRRLRAGSNGKFVPQDYELASVKFDSKSSTVQGDLLNGKYPTQPALDLKLSILKNNVVRFGVREKNPLFPRWEVRDVLIEESLAPANDVSFSHTTQGSSLSFGPNKIEITNKPFGIILSVGDKKAISINEHNLLLVEQYREKNPQPAEGEAPSPNAVRYPYDDDGSWEEHFGSHRDSKPRGPSGLSLDINFIGTENVYGIPEHASSFSLKSTRDGLYADPYRLWNLDVFEYELNSPMALYGAVPLLLSHDQDKTVGAFWLNSAETWVDVWETKIGTPQKNVQWISESGVIDTFLFLGPKPKDVFYQYNSLTGFPALPQRFATAYHQCRWNYRSEEDVAQVDAGFDEHDIPYDVLWLDIEHTDGKKYFTWDKTSFPNPIEMQNKLAAKSRKMVTIIDPHIKRDGGYQVHNDAQNKNLYIKDRDKKDFEGWCWPGSVSYLDFLAPQVRDYWASRFALDKYEGSTKHLYTWNDMNEPSVFNGPEVTMHKDCLHLDGSVEHRDVHNLYGFYQQMATAQGQIQRDNARPFVLSRAFFAGTQRYGAIWTGDNKAGWDHLAAATPMLLSMGVGGITFSGADVGGFFGDPDTELLLRWYQAGAFTPFFRGHAHIDTKRREPWLFGEPWTTLIRNAIRRRYAYLPYIYSTFYEANITGTPVLRPLWSEFPSDSQTFASEDQFLLGGSLLVHPITESGRKNDYVYLPQPAVWYETETWAKHNGGQTISASAPLEYIPVFQRGGSIIPKRERARRNSDLMEHDPYTLIVALDQNNEASGHLYIDDGRTFDFLKGSFIYRLFKFSNSILSSTKASSVVASGDNYQNHNTIERIVIVGLSAQPTKITLKYNNKETQLTSQYDAQTGRLTIRKPDVVVASDWSIQLH